MVLKTIPNKWTLNLKRANNYNLTTLMGLQNVLKSIEKVDESGQ